MKCPYCGLAVADTATVCPNCGGPLTPVEVPAPDMPPIGTPGPEVPRPVPPDDTQRLTVPDAALLAEPPLRPPPPSAWSATSGALPPPADPPVWTPPPAAPLPGATMASWTPPPAPPRPNRTPLIVAGIAVAVLAVCCLGGVALALLGVLTTASTPYSPTTTPVALVFPSDTATPIALVFPSIAAPTPSSGDTPPRMSLDEFKKLYDDPAQRPLIIDVRAAETYNNGHIKGAISFPESDVDARVAELPKDKLIIAYCQ